MAATGKTVAEIARDRGVTRQAIYDVLKCRTKTPELRALIASFTSKPIPAKSLTDLWPEEVLGDN